MLLRREIVTVLPKQHRPALVLAVFPHSLRSFPSFTQWQTLAHFWQKRPLRVRPSSKRTKVRFCSENHRDAPDVLTPSRFDGKRRIPFPFAPFSLMNSSLAELFIDSFWQILLPLMKPALFSAGLFQFLWTYNDYFNSLIFINSVKKYTVSLALRLSVDAESVVVWGRVMAMACVAVLPLVLLFFAAQKYFVEGIATSGLKG